MAVSKVPTDWFGAGYAYASNQITINTAAHGTPSLAELSAANANASTGDIRQIMLAICDRMYNKWVSLADVDRPARMLISRNSSEDSSGNIVRDVTFRFYTQSNDALTVIAE